MNCFLLKLKLKRKYVKGLSKLEVLRRLDTNKNEKKVVKEIIKKVKKINSQVIDDFFQINKSFQTFLKYVKSKEPKVSFGELRGLVKSLQIQKEKLEKFLEAYKEECQKKS